MFSIVFGFIKKGSLSCDWPVDFITKISVSFLKLKSKDLSYSTQPFSDISISGFLEPVFRFPFLVFRFYWTFENSSPIQLGT